jgi:hypothetical protein
MGHKAERKRSKGQRAVGVGSADPSRRAGGRGCIRGVASDGSAGGFAPPRPGFVPRTCGSAVGTRHASSPRTSGKRGGPTAAMTCSRKPYAPRAIVELTKRTHPGRMGRRWRGRDGCGRQRGPVRHRWSMWKYGRHDCRRHGSIGCAADESVAQREDVALGTIRSTATLQENRQAEA